MAVNIYAPRLIERNIYRVIRTPKGRLLTGGIHRHDAPGLDVRAQFSDDDLSRSAHAGNWGRREIAKEWKRAILAKGSFIEVNG